MVPIGAGLCLPYGDQATSAGTRPSAGRYTSIRMTWPAAVVTGTSRSISIAPRCSARGSGGRPARDSGLLLGGRNRYGMGGIDSTSVAALAELDHANGDPAPVLRVSAQRASGSPASSSAILVSQAIVPSVIHAGESIEAR
jgi:hypothetical protein